jgi:hypothetical protein
LPPPAGLHNDGPCGSDGTPFLHDAEADELHGTEAGQERRRGFNPAAVALDPRRWCLGMAEDPVGENLVPKGGTNTTVFFSSKGANDQRAPSVDFTFFFHYC